MVSVSSTEGMLLLVASETSFPLGIGETLISLVPTMHEGGLFPRPRARR
jgi:hypothetical protein